MWKEEDRQEDIEVKKVKYIEQKKEAKLKAIPYGPQGIKIWVSLEGNSFIYKQSRAVKPMIWMRIYLYLLLGFRHPDPSNFTAPLWY
jgi:hypothetical protein